MDSLPQTTPSTSSPPRRNPTLKAFGLGSAGLKILEQLATDGLPPESIVAVHSEASVLAACSAGEKIHLDVKAAPGASAANGSGGMSETPAEDQIPRLLSLCSGAEVVIIIAGLGGAIGTGLSAVLAGAARKAGAFVLAFVALPFDCEGSARAQIAGAGLKNLADAADIIVPWPNQRTLSLIDEATTLIDTFKTSNRLLGQTVRGSCRALQSEVAMGLSFLDLCRAIRNHSTLSVFATAEAAGPNRASEAVERLLAHPMLDASSSFPSAQAVAVCVLAGPSLAMAEVSRIMEAFHGRCEPATVLMGAAIEPGLGDSLVIALLLAPSAKVAGDSDTTDEQVAAGPAPRDGTAEQLGAQLLDIAGGGRKQSRFVPPPPFLPPDKMAQLLKQQARAAGRGRKSSSKLRQGQLPLEIISKGRFDKSEPTIHKGEDLDVPTYIRRGVALN